MLNLNLKYILSVQDINYEFFFEYVNILLIDLKFMDCKMINAN